jgi:hypothetical protein
MNKTEKEVARTAPKIIIAIAALIMFAMALSWAVARFDSVSQTDVQRPGAAKSGFLQKQ